VIPAGVRDAGNAAGAAGRSGIKRQSAERLVLDPLRRFIFFDF
jgi:hypothetical protein